MNFADYCTIHVPGAAGRPRVRQQEAIVDLSTNPRHAGNARTLMSQNGENQPAKKRLPRVSAPIARHYLNLAATLGWAPDQSNISHVGLSSCKVNSGVSTVCQQLALTLAMHGHSILLVDASSEDELDPSSSGHRPDGLTDYLLGKHSQDSVQPTSEARLLYMPRGRASLHHVSLDNFRTGIDSLTSAFDLVIFDLPPLFPESPDFAWYSQLHPLVLVTTTETSSREIHWAKRRLAEFGSVFAGMIRNNVAGRMN